VNNFVIAKIFSNRIEATIAQGFLEQHGIDSHIQADDMGGIRPELAFSNGVKLFVAVANLEKAVELLE